MIIKNDLVLCTTKVLNDGFLQTRIRVDRWGLIPKDVPLQNTPVCTFLGLVIDYTDL